MMDRVNSYIHSEEIRSRIEKTRSTRWRKCAALLGGILDAYRARTKKLGAFEMCMYRRVLRIPCSEHITNAEVMRRIGREREVLNTVKIWNLQYLRHILRNDNRFHFLRKILQEKVLRRRGVGRRKILWFENLRTWFDMNNTELFRTTPNIVCMVG